MRNRDEDEGFDHKDFSSSLDKVGQCTRLTVYKVDSVQGHK
jgi:hypothetical protein